MTQTWHIYAVFCRGGNFGTKKLVGSTRPNSINFATHNKKFSYLRHSSTHRGHNNVIPFAVCLEMFQIMLFLLIVKQKKLKQKLITLNIHIKFFVWVTKILYFCLNEMTNAVKKFRVMHREGWSTFFKTFKIKREGGKHLMHITWHTLCK